MSRKAKLVADWVLDNLKSYRSRIEGMDDDQLRRELKEKEGEVSDYISDYYDYEEDEDAVAGLEDLVDDVIKLARKRKWSPRDRKQAEEYILDWDDYMSSAVS
jgi:hypothetical protein